MTKENLVAYIKRKLGDPVIRIEIDDTQVNDCIEEALTVFYDQHFYGVDAGILLLDLVVGQKTYILDDAIKEVKFIYPSSTFLNDENLLVDLPETMLSSGDYYNNVDIPSLENWFQEREMVHDYVQRSLLYTFNSSTKELSLYVTPTQAKQVALHVFKIPSNTEKIYDDLWFKKYVVSLAGLQWAVNIGKYGGAPLPGGATLNYSEIESRYTAQKEAAEEELYEKYTEPIDFLIG